MSSSLKTLCSCHSTVRGNRSGKAGEREHVRAGAVEAGAAGCRRCSLSPAIVRWGSLALDVLADLSDERVPCSGAVIHKVEHELGMAQPIERPAPTFLQSTRSRAN